MAENERGLVNAPGEENFAFPKHSHPWAEEEFCREAVATARESTDGQIEWDGFNPQKDLGWIS